MTGDTLEYHMTPWANLASNIYIYNVRTLYRPPPLHARLARSRCTRPQSCIGWKNPHVSPNTTLAIEAIANPLLLLYPQLEQQRINGCTRRDAKLKTPSAQPTSNKKIQHALASSTSSSSNNHANARSRTPRRRTLRAHTAGYPARVAGYTPISALNQHIGRQLK